MSDIDRPQIYTDNTDKKTTRRRCFVFLLSVQIRVHLWPITFALFPVSGNKPDHERTRTETNNTKQKLFIDYEAETLQSTVSYGLITSRWNIRPAKTKLTRRWTMRSAKSTGRTIGVLLLLQMACGLVVPFVLWHPLIVGSPAFLTAAVASSFQIRTGIFLSFIGGTLTVAMAITAWPIIRQYSETIALWFLVVCAISCTL